MSIRDHIARRSDYNETKDYFPTPPYATRALFRYLLPAFEERKVAEAYTIWDPACGGGHMSEVFKEYGFSQRISTDIEDYGYGGLDEKVSFQQAVKKHRADLIITNPPYGAMAAFVDHGLNASGIGLALLTRIQFLEGQVRHRDIFSVRPPTMVGVFADRIPFKMNKVVPKAPKMFTHCWVVWLHGAEPRPLQWIPPEAQSLLEKEGDYD